MGGICLDSFFCEGGGGCLAFVWPVFLGFSCGKQYFPGALG